MRKEEQAVKESLNKREIDYKDYNDKLLDISRRRTEKERELEDNPFKAGFLDSAVGAFSAIHMKQVEVLNKMQEEYDLANEHYLKAKEEANNKEIKYKQILLENIAELDNIESERKIALAEATAEQIFEIEMRYDAMRRDKINEHIGLEQEANTARIIANKEMNDAMILAQEKSSNLMSQSLSAGVSAMISSFAQLKKEGASTQKALLVSMLAGLKASIPIYVAQIIGKSLGEFTLAGIAVSAGLTAILYAALGAAESAVSSANFFKGGLVKAKNSSEYGVDKMIKEEVPNELE